MQRLEAGRQVAQPQTAVDEALGEDLQFVVFRLGDDNRVSRIKVQTARQAGDRTEITSALDVGTRLVASGAGFLNDGDLVRAVEGADAAPAPQNAASSAKR